MSEPNWQERLIRRVAEDQTGDDHAAGHASAPSPDPPPSPQAPPPSGPAPQPAPARHQRPMPPPQYQQQPYPQPPPYPQQPPYQQQQPPYPQQQAPYGDAGEDRGLMRRLGRIASEAAYLAGGSSRMQRDLDNIGIIRRPIAITRTMGVVSPVRESGASIVAALMTDVLGAQRSDRVVAIDADPHQVELSRRLELAIGAGGSRIQLIRCDPTPEAVREAVGGVAGGSHGVGAAVIDCPAGLATPVTTYVANSSHGLVLSMPSVRHVAEYCLGELDRLGVAAQQLLVAKGLAVVNLVDSTDQDSIRWMVAWLQDRGVTTVVIPYDEHLAQAWPLRPDHLRPATRRAVLELTARALARALGETPGDPR